MKATCDFVMVICIIGMLICGVLSLLDTRGKQKMKAICDFVTAICIIGMFICGVLLMLDKAFGSPEVFYSWSSKECKYVVMPDGSRTDCTHINELVDYEWRWTE